MTKNLLKIYPLVGWMAFWPMLAVAQFNLYDILTVQVRWLLNSIISLLFILATVVFLFGVVKFIASSADPASREKSKGIMLWGIIGMAVMAAAWGVANILVNYFLSGASSPPRTPPPTY